MMAILAEKFYKEMPEVDWDKFLEKIDEAIEPCGEEAKSPRPAPQSPVARRCPIMRRYGPRPTGSARSRGSATCGRRSAGRGTTWMRKRGAEEIGTVRFSFPELPILPIPDDRATPPL